MVPILTLNKLETQKHSKWQHKNTAHKQSNKHKSKQTEKHIYKHKNWGKKGRTGGHHAPKIQPTDWAPLLKNFLLQCIMLYYCKSSVETPTTRFWQLIFNILCNDVHSQLWACQAVGANHHHCSSISPIQGNVTGVICRVVTPKDNVKKS